VESSHQLSSDSGLPAPFLKPTKGVEVNTDRITPSYTSKSEEVEVQYTRPQNGVLYHT